MPMKRIIFLSANRGWVKGLNLNVTTNPHFFVCICNDRRVPYSLWSSISHLVRSVRASCPWFLYHHCLSSGTKIFCFDWLFDPQFCPGCPCHAGLPRARKIVGRFSTRLHTVHGALRIHKYISIYRCMKSFRDGRYDTVKQAKCFGPPGPIDDTTAPARVYVVNANGFFFPSFDESIYLFSSFGFRRS